MVKLTEFSTEELAFAHAVFNERRKTALYSLARHHEIGTDPTHETVKEWEKELDLSQNWIIQIKNSLDIVSETQTVNQN